LPFQGAKKGKMDASDLLNYFNAGVPGTGQIKDGVK
jgi:hypothetical protein